MLFVRSVFKLSVVSTKPRRGCSMLTYEPSELEAELKSAYEAFLNDPGLDEILTDFYDLTDPDFDKDSTDEIVTTETEIAIELPRCDEAVSLTVGSFIDLARELQSAELIDNVKCQSHKSTLYRVSCNYVDAWRTIEYNLEPGKEILRSSVDSAEGRLECSLVSGTTIFGFLVASKGEYEKYFPPVLEDDLFVQIKHASTRNAFIIDQIFQSYIFELSCSAGIDLSLSPRPMYYEETGEEPEPSELKVKLKPLLMGRGMHDLLSLYNSTITTDADVRVLYFTKVFEYVSQSVVRLQQTSIIQMKLNSPKALNPDAEYVLELEALFDEQKVFRKDKEAIIITAVTCCDAFELAKSAPKFLKSLSSITNKSKKKERDDALKEFASSLADTRNQIAHAKSNYQPTDAECPTDDMHCFSICAKQAAQQVIRWFSALNEQQRVI